MIVMNVTSHFSSCKIFLNALDAADRIGLNCITIFRLVEAATKNKFLWIDDAWVTGYLGIIHFVL